MRRREVPVRLGKRLVFVITQTHHGFGLALGDGPVQIGRGVIDRVATKNDQRINRTGIQDRRQLLDGSGIGDRHRVERHRVADGTQGGIDGVGQQMHFQGLRLAGHDQGISLVRGQIQSAFGNPRGNRASRRSFDRPGGDCSKSYKARARMAI